MAEAAFSVEIPDDQTFARALDVSLEAVQLCRQSDLLDLHIEGILVPRLWPYDVYRRHGLGVLRGRWFGHLDFPRILDAGLTGAMWAITTNPWRTPGGRWRVFLKNLERIRALIDGGGGLFRVVKTYAEYVEAQAAGAHACLLSIQGGNAIEAAPDGPASIPDDCIVRITLVHLVSSVYGITSSPMKLLNRDGGLTNHGRTLVRQMNDRRILVDLAHINPASFWDAHEVHDASQPLIATHTGVDGVRPHWRNLDDRQIKAIADTGGTVGVIYSQAFLARRGGPRDGRMVLEHMQHIIDVAGEDFVSIGSDYDGAIVPPPDLRDGRSYPRLVQHMLDAGWSTERIQKILGLNALRVLEAIRPK